MWSLQHSPTLQPFSGMYALGILLGIDLYEEHKKGFLSGLKITTTTASDIDLAKKPASKDCNSMGWYLGAKSSDCPVQESSWIGE